MRLRPSSPNSPIPDIEEDSNPSFANQDEADGQELFNDHLLQKNYFERTPETDSHQEIYAEHGIIYYEYAQRSSDQTHLQQIPKNSPQSFEQPPDDLVVNAEAIERDYADMLKSMNLQLIKPN